MFTLTTDYTLTTDRVDGAVVHTITDPQGRVLDTRSAACAYRGVVLTISEMSDRAGVWSWHLTTDGARAAADRLTRVRPEVHFRAVTAA
ncbi:hypothetical protein [Agilicoccus flavus]|uniref:hypothetical protein n=1 Tax=Agilicoccus flavus TaxID=2775968 RepID=UPI001CF6F2B7|nr:hypothetical protein [Agilicoccus flavus]